MTDRDKRIIARAKRQALLEKKQKALAKKGRGLNTVYPSGSMKLRTADDWQEVIQKSIPVDAIPKITCLVWWDHIDAVKSNLTTSAWFRTQLDSYVHEIHDLPFDKIVPYLIKIGYSERAAKSKRSNEEIKKKSIESNLKKRIKRRIKS